jgi:hypothetical protein
VRERERKRAAKKEKGRQALATTPPKTNKIYENQTYQKTN